jgi:HSP20 family protein
MMETIKRTEDNGSTAPERTHAGQTYVPAVDIFELPDKLMLQADVPGATVNDIEIHYERGLLTIHAHVQPRNEQPGNCLLREYGVGDFHRSFQIGEGIDSNGIEAEMSNGVLTLHLPKAEAARTRKIAVKGANGSWRAAEHE